MFFGDCLIVYVYFLGIIALQFAFQANPFVFFILLAFRMLQDRISINFASVWFETDPLAELYVMLWISTEILFLEFRYIVSCHQQGIPPNKSILLALFKVGSDDFAVYSLFLVMYLYCITLNPIPAVILTGRRLYCYVCRNFIQGLFPVRFRIFFFLTNKGFY